MYKKFFGLKENPFNMTPDPRFLYSTPHTEEALACLRYCVESRKGFVMLTGDVGTGKTTLLNKLLEWLRQEQVASAFVFNPRLNPFQFLDYALSDFGVNCESRLKSVILTELNNWLIARHQAGSTAVLIVDEAQDASPDLLEEIRLLTNLELPSGKLLQIVLAGQQELEMKLRLPEFRQLRQRITMRAKTHPLTLEETGEYIVTRLRIGGSDGRQIFSPEAVNTLHKYSEGIPRIINILCEDSLISAFADHQSVVASDIVENVARELELDLFPATAPPPSELRLDDMVQPGVYTNRSRAVRVSPQPPPPAQTSQGDRRVPPTAGPSPARPVNPQPAVRRPAPVAQAPVEPPAPPMVQSTGGTPAVENAGERMGRQNTDGLGWAQEPAPPESRRLAAGDVPLRSDKPSFDEEFLQALRSKEATSKATSVVPPVRPSAPSPSTAPRPAAPPPAFMAVKKSPSSGRRLWLAIAGVLVAGAGGAFLIWTHTSESTPPAITITPEPPAPGPEAPSGSTPGVDNQAMAAPAATAPEEEHVAPPPTPQSATAVESAPSEPARRARPAAPPRERSIRPAEPTVVREAAPQRVGKGVITSSVEGAIIIVDGKRSQDWVTPHVFPNLPVGTHTVVVSKQGYNDVSTRMTIREGETSYFRATLTPSSGEISIITEPPGLPVSIDGGPFRPSPVQVSLAAGSHKYQIRLPNSSIYEGSVEMRAGSIITRRVDFTGGEWLNPAQ